MIKIQTKAVYNKILDSQEYKEYQKKQIAIHDKKLDRKRPVSEYVICANHMMEHIKSGGKMLCLGTRNEHEKDSFKSLLSNKGIQVFSQDLAPLAKADFTCDFNELSKHVSADWDILFSNCLDHAVDASATIYDWLKVLNMGGIMILGFCFVEATSKGDVCEFSYDSVEKFISETKELEKINNYKSGAWHYWTTKKVGVL